jgi:hypothetical protein
MCLFLELNNLNATQNEPQRLRLDFKTSQATEDFFVLDLRIG